MDQALRGMLSFVETSEKLLLGTRKKGMTHLIVDLRENGGG